MTSGKLSFNRAIRLYDKMSVYLDKSKSRSAQISGRLVRAHMAKATAPGAKCAWTSVLFPAEVLRPFGIYAMTLEVIAGVFATLGLSRTFLDAADESDVPMTMCSFHRMLMGISKKGFIGKPYVVGATSLLCDGNVKSFGEVAGEQNVPFLFIDIPHEESPEAIKYVKTQLEEMCKHLADLTGVTNYKEALKEIAQNSNKAFALQRQFYNSRRSSDKNLFQGHEIANFAFPAHFMLGSENLIKAMEARCNDVEFGKKHNKFYKHSQFDEGTRRLMWLHIVPQYGTDMWKIIDSGLKSKIVCDEYSPPYFEDYDINDPLASIAKRLINHPSNGPITRRIEHILKVAKDYKVDGMIHYSSWGCHQAAGNVHLLGKAIQDAGFKFLNINGDAVDQDNLSFEQHRTRLEAFLENLSMGTSKNLVESEE